MTFDASGSVSNVGVPKTGAKKQRFPVSDWYWNSLETIWIARKDEREKAEAEAAAKLAARKAKSDARKAGGQARKAKGAKTQRGAAVEAEKVHAETSMDLPSEGETKPARSSTGVVRRNARQQRVAARNSTQ